MRNNGIVWGLILLGVLLLLGLIGGVQLNNSVAAVDQRSKLLEARVDEVANDAALTALQQRQDNLEAKIATLVSPDLGPLETAVAELRGGLDGLETRLANFTPAGLDTLTTRLDTLEAAVTAATPVDLGPVTASVEALRGDVATLSTQIGDLSPAALTALGTRLAAVEGDISAMAPATPVDLGPLNSEIAALGTRIDEIESRFAAISFPSLLPIEERIAALDAKVAALAPTDLTPLEERVTVLDAKVAAIVPVDLGGLEGEIAGIQTDLLALRGDLSTKADPADVAVVADQLTALGARIDALPTIDTGPLSTAIASLEAGLQGLQTQIADLGVLRSDVDGLKTNPPKAPPLSVLASIYFGAASTSPAGDELAKIAALAQRLGTNPGDLSIVGFSDSSGPAELNRSLSLRRAAAVRLALIKAGIPAAAVTSVSGLGEDAPPITTDDDTEEAQNRVVVIYGR